MRHTYQAGHGQLEPLKTLYPNTIQYTQECQTRKNFLAPAFSKELNFNDALNEIWVRLSQNITYLMCTEDLDSIDPHKVFGMVSCEDELDHYSDRYEDHFFFHAPFNDSSLGYSTYLIVGRRGSGKTSLTQFFGFQRKIPNAIHIDVDEPVAYEEVLTRVSECAIEDYELALKRVVKIWELVIWLLVFRKLSIGEKSQTIFVPSIPSDITSPSGQIKFALEQIDQKAESTPEYLPLDVGDALTSDWFIEQQEQAIAITRNTPIIVSIDSLERYSVQNDAMMRATAGLIEASSRIHNKHTYKNQIHIKTFISAETYPFISETAVSNTLKFISDPVFLSWRPKDIIRLVAFRLYIFLTERGDSNIQRLKDDEWDSFNIIKERVWDRCFGKKITNGKGVVEDTFPYVLRHTQMRPRQVIVVCNRMAKLAVEKGEFPHFSGATVRQAIEESEKQLATEVLNSYEKVYPNVGKIVDALDGLPILNLGQVLDRVASRTSSQWPNGTYSSYQFRQLVAELGIIGKVRHHNKELGIVEADFEYHQEDRLALQTDQLCVFHPMFNKKLNIKNPNKLIVYPFPNTPDYSNLSQ